MKRFIVCYEHTQYGYYSTILEDFDSIDEALIAFIADYRHKKVYGIMEIS